MGTLARTGTHLQSIEELRHRLVEALPVQRVEQLRVPFQCVAASIERAAEHWFSEGELADVVLASCAVPGVLPPVRIGDEHFIDGGIVNSIPVARAVALGATTIYVLQVGRLERPLRPPRWPWEVGMVAFEVARRHRFASDLTSLPDGVRLHVLPTGGSAAPAYNDLAGQLRVRRIARGIGQQIETSYQASLRYLGGVLMAPAAVRRPVTVTIMLVTSIVVLIASPLLLAVAALVAALTGRPALIFARLGIDYFALELACLVACAWLWMASLCGLLMKTRSLPAPPLRAAALVRPRLHATLAGPARHPRRGASHRGHGCAGG